MKERSSCQRSRRNAQNASTMNVISGLGKQEQEMREKPHSTNVLSANIPGENIDEF